MSMISWLTTSSNTLASDFMRAKIGHGIELGKFLSAWKSLVKMYGAHLGLKYWDTS